MTNLRSFGFVIRFDTSSPPQIAPTHVVIDSVNSKPSPTDKYVLYGIHTCTPMIINDNTIQIRVLGVNIDSFRISHVSRGNINQDVPKPINLELQALSLRA